MPLPPRSAHLLRFIRACSRLSTIPNCGRLGLAPTIQRTLRPTFTRSSSTVTAMATDSEPAGTVTKDGKVFRAVTEGKATILVPQGAKIGEDHREVQQVFYNPIQQYNRDLSVLAIKVYGDQLMEKRQEFKKAKLEKQSKKRKRSADEGPLDLEPKAENQQETAPAHGAGRFKILDALSASGLRALRYAHELPFVTQVVANDLSASAAETIKMNVKHNGLEDKISVTNEDALGYMYRTIADGLSKRDKHGNPTRMDRFDVIDLDPYGTAAPFFDAAVQAVRDDGGLLCITCTDSAVWAGHSYPEKTFALYGGVPIKGLHAHEAGLRLILNAVATSAARYGLAIEPQLSLSIDFYTKLFIKVTKSQHAVKFLGARTMLVYNCDSGCGAWETQRLIRSQETPNKNGRGMFIKHIVSQGPTTDRLCPHCNFKMHVAGPMYAGHLHSRDFVQRMLDEIPKADPATYGTLKRLQGMLQTVLEEYIPPPPPPEPEPVAEDEEPEPEPEPLNEVDAALAEYDRSPFFVLPSKLSHSLSCATPGFDVFRGALMHMGYRVGRSHCRPGSIKTDAPWPVIWSIMTEWIKQKSPIKADKVRPEQVGFKILNDAGIVPTPEVPELTEDEKKMEWMADEEKAEQLAEEMAAPPDPIRTLRFTEDLEKLGRSTAGQKVVRYQANPLPNWGPLTKASRQ